VQQYIGTIIEIPDHYQKSHNWEHGQQAPETMPAAEFAESFYRSLALGQSIGEALGSARREFFDKPGIPIWAMYVHYGDPLYRFMQPPVNKKVWIQRSEPVSVIHRPVPATEVFLF